MLGKGYYVKVSIRYLYFLTDFTSIGGLLDFLLKYTLLLDKKVKHKCINREKSKVRILHIAFCALCTLHFLTPSKSTGLTVSDARRLEHSGMF